ncbi:MAG: hypothetical protein BJ554DRAFT_5448 [Olpidium bornovanus]|uniref:Uncharacterized protein n=1 Tax=Olpidium bornovanus TaxID=278681 RepID=A0A8H7ZZF2_9FUNG|nr:MAG: hypothetical protein BJ554DRAFT_5448 [Olpidium bornovanus]
MSTAPPTASTPARIPPSAEVELLQAKLRIAELEKEKLELELRVTKRVAVWDDYDDVDNLFTGNLEKTNTTVIERLVLSDSESEDEGDPTVGDALPELLAFVLPDGPLNTVLSEELQERLPRGANAADGTELPPNARDPGLRETRSCEAGFVDCNYTPISIDAGTMGCLTAGCRILIETQEVLDKAKVMREKFKATSKESLNRCQKSLK